MFRPTSYPEWASNATNVAYPTTNERAVGWAENEIPPSSYFNWQQSLYYRWIEYLDWYSRLEPIVYDDFVYPSGLNATHLYSKWSFTAGDITLVPNNTTGFGHITLLRSASGLSSFVVGVNPRTNDFRFETICESQIMGISGGVHVGFPDFCAFVATSASGTWGFQFVPSGFSLGSCTSVSFSGVTGTSVGAFRKFAVERQGATMNIEINGNIVRSMPGVAFGESGVNTDCGARVNARSTNIVSVIMDKISLHIKRNPM